MKDNNEEEIKFREYFNKIISSNKNIKYLGFVENIKLPIFYQLSDLQVMPSLCQEGAGLSAIEGMVSGLPLIVTNSGGLIEYVNKECSIILEADKNLTNNLSKNIALLKNDPAKLERMSIASKENGKQYLFSEYYKNFKNIFK